MRTVCISAPGLTGVVSGSVLQTFVPVKWGSCACAHAQRLPSLPLPCTRNGALIPIPSMGWDFPRRFIKLRNNPMNEIFDTTDHLVTELLLIILIRHKTCYISVNITLLYFKRRGDYGMLYQLDEIGSFYPARIKKIIYTISSSCNESRVVKTIQ